MKYVDSENTVREEFLALLKVDDATASGQKNLLTKYFKKVDVPLENMIGLGLDNASVNMGRENGLAAQLLRENPQLFVLGCTCHTAALCASAAAKHLPAEVETFVKELINFISASPKRQLELKVFQEFCEIANHRLLQISGTRWLSLEAGINILLEQWPALHLYLTDLSLTSSDSSTRDKAKKLLSAMDIGVNKAYLYFLSYILAKINKFNLEFQSRGTRIHCLLRRTRELYLSTLQCFLRPEKLKGNFTSLNVSSPENFLKLENVKLGMNTELHLESLSVEDRRHWVQAIRKACLAYLIELAKQIRTRIRLDDPVLTSLELLDPLKAMSNETMSLFPLLQRFKHVAVRDCRTEGERMKMLEDLNSEYEEIQIRSEFISEIVSESDLECPPTFWKRLTKLKDGSGKAMFRVLPKFMLTLCALSHASAGAERQFSSLNIIKTTGRNRLNIDTVGALMHSKQLCLRDTRCVSEWEIPPAQIDRCRKWKMNANEPGPWETEEDAGPAFKL